MICATISLTWITLLILYLMKQYNDPILIALLMGESVVGIYYMLEGKVKDELKAFRLPFITTLTFVAYYIISKPADITNVIILLAVVWAFTFIIYLYRNNPNANRFMKKLVECCKKW